MLGFGGARNSRGQPSLSRVNDNAGRRPVNLLPTRPAARPCSQICVTWSAPHGPASPWMRKRTRRCGDRDSWPPGTQSQEVVNSGSAFKARSLRCATLLLETAVRQLFPSRVLCNTSTEKRSSIKWFLRRRASPSCQAQGVSARGRCRRHASQRLHLGTRFTPLRSTPWKQKTSGKH